MNVIKRFWRWLTGLFKPEQLTKSGIPKDDMLTEIGVVTLDELHKNRKFRRACDRFPRYSKRVQSILNRHNEDK